MTPAEHMRLIRQDRVTHGETAGRRHSKEYSAWHHMKQRCRSPKCEAYPDYGGRGITVCDRWLTFENFLADMGRAPGPEYTLDRYPNNNGNYEPGNCRWATRAEQNRNFRRNRLLAIYGKVLPAKDWARIAGTPYATVLSRIRAGWTVKAAVFGRTK